MPTSLIWIGLGTIILSIIASPLPSWIKLLCFGVILLFIGVTTYKASDRNNRYKDYING
jgi:hypothetical protein